MPFGQKSDYYDLLDVDRNASAYEIKRAYRKQAVKYHPDHNPDDKKSEERFKELSYAYSVLSDPQKRKRYDMLGHSAFTAGASGYGYDRVDFSSIGEMLEGLFGDVWGRRSAAARMPRDINYDLKISFEEAALGTEKTIEFDRDEICPRCQGSRSEPGSSPVPCPACQGRGTLRPQRGFFSQSRPCNTCDGTGTRVVSPCIHCKGSGTVRRRESLSVRIPAGIEDGAVRTIRGAGEISVSGRGNLHVNVYILEHSIFTRNGSDIICEVPVSFPQAALGAELQIPTLDGKVKMKLPVGTQSGRVFRLRGKGMPVFGGYGKGDQLLKIIVEVPENLTERQRELLEQLAVEMGTDTHPQQKSFMEKLKALFE
jgi:molecular chaperone DnaJ